MATPETVVLSLLIPSTSESYDIGVHNSNMQKIDEQPCFKQEFGTLIADLNNALTSGIYNFNTDATNKPVAATAGILEVSVSDDVEASATSIIIHKAILNIAGNHKIYIRKKVGTGAWSAWSLIDNDSVPTSRTINNKALTSNITLTPTDIGAVPDTRTINGVQLNTNIDLTPADIGALASGANAVSADKTLFRTMTADLHDWLPLGITGGLYVGEGTGIINAPDAGWWRYIGNVHTNLNVIYRTIIAQSFGINSLMYIKTCEGKMEWPYYSWSNWIQVVTVDSNGKVPANQASAHLIVIEKADTTITDAHAGKFLWCGNSSGTPIVLTIPTSTPNIPLYTEIEIAQSGSSTITVATENPWHLMSLGSLKTIAGQAGTASLKKISADTWLLSGALR